MYSFESAVDLPPIWCPIELRVRSDEEMIQQNSERFFRRHGFSNSELRSTKAMATGNLACLWVPDGSLDGTQLLSDWLMWALLFDDSYCDGGEPSRSPARFGHGASGIMGRALYPVSTGAVELKSDRYAAALQDIFSRIYQQGGPDQEILCGLAHFRWCVGAGCGVGDRRDTYLRSLDEHLTARPMDGGDLISIYLTEVASNSWLPARLRVDRRVRAITNAAGVLLTVPTDLASLAHETEQNSLESNIVEILAKEREIGLQDAVHESCALLEEITQMFLNLRSVLLDLDDASLSQYVNNLSCIVRGTLEWQRHLPRYAYSADEILGTTEDLSNRVVPLHDVSAERQYNGASIPRSIQWWWDCV